MILAIIIACEIGFWVFLLSGLALRYLARQPRWGLGLIAMAPLVDLVLLGATVVDLRSGGHATSAHALSAFYIGFSVAYGHRLITWADRKFARRYGPDERPGPPPKLYGRQYTAYSWRTTLLTWIAAAVASALLAGMIWLVGDPEKTKALSQSFHVVRIVVVVDLIITISYTIWPPRAPRTEENGERSTDGQVSSPSSENHVLPENSDADRNR
jgi:hypothetical protein